MIQAMQEHVTSSKPAHPKAIDLGEILSVDRIAVSMAVSSKKKLLENIAALLLKNVTALNETAILRILTERERLGSTGIGKGVALPHGRVPGLKEAVGAFATLERPIDFDAIDKQPVIMVFALLVPAEANERHLQILARLAAMFDDPKLRNALTKAKSVNEMYADLTHWDGRAADIP